MDVYRKEDTGITESGSDGLSSPSEVPKLQTAELAT